MPKKHPLKRRVRLWLAAHDMTQNALADRLGIQPSRLSRIVNERERASLDEAVKFAEVTGIPVRDFAEVTL